MSIPWHYSEEMKEAIMMILGQEPQQVNLYIITGLRLFIAVLYPFNTNLILRKHQSTTYSSKEYTLCISHF